jgi:1,4-dihydroxy-2-naphthoate octaprenyltransferase
MRRDLHGSRDRLGISLLRAIGWVGRMKSTLGVGYMPRVTSSEWASAGWAARWMVVSRARVLALTVAACTLGGLLSLAGGGFDALRWLVCLAGLLLAHAANNQLNDFVDSQRGVDGGDYFRRRYGTHVLEDGLMARRTLVGYLSVTLGAAGACGLALVWLSGAAVLIPLLLGALLLVTYTHPLKGLGLGEPAVLAVWGPLMVGGTDLAVTGSWHTEAAWVGTLFALGPTAVLFGKHIDKLAHDRAKGVRTLPVRLGHRRSRRVVIALLALQLTMTVMLALLGALPWPTLLVLAAAPRLTRLARIYRAPAPGAPPAGYPEAAWPLWYVAYAFDYAGRFGALFLLGFAAHYALAASSAL